MKITLILRFAIGLLCLVASTVSFAQARATPALLGYWNVETNLTTRDYTIVRFYDQQDRLVYEERIDNLCLDLSKGDGRCRRASRKLAVTLQHVMREPKANTSGTLLAQQFNLNRRTQRAYATR